MAAKGVRIMNLRLFERFYAYTARQQLLKLYCTKNSDKDKIFEILDNDIKPLHEERKNDVVDERAEPSSLEQGLSNLTENKSDVKLSGFAKSFQEHEKLLNQIGSSKVESKDEKPESFAYLLRHSNFINLGDPEGKIVLGTIYHVVDDDLYIDFGWKFPTICKKPKTKQDYFKRGTRVRLLIKDLELATRFVGSKHPITLNEADCVLLGVERSRPDGSIEESVS